MYFYMKMEELKVFYDFDIGMWRNMDYKYSTMDNLILSKLIYACLVSNMTEKHLN